VTHTNQPPEFSGRFTKYRPGFPSGGFASLEQARMWAADFVRWYNHDHRHSALRYVVPAQRHAGDDQTILARRHGLYQAARQLHPRRWSGATRNWSPIGPVTLNPERDVAVPITTQTAQRKIHTAA